MCTSIILSKRPTYLFVLAHPGGDSSFIVPLPFKLSLSQEYVSRSLLVPVTFPVNFASVPFFTRFFTRHRWQL